MTELRQDYLTGQWVTIAEDRALRPMLHKYETDTLPDDKGLCPFCLENRHLTEEETHISGKVRVLPNIYPALDRHSPEGFGFHEVIVDTPEHNLQLEDFSPDDICNVLETIRSRMEFFYKDSRIKYVQVFKNQGFEAGASIFHSHWQIVAMPLIPPKIEIMGENFERYSKEHNNECYLCGDGELLAHAAGLTSRYPELTVQDRDGVIVYVPYGAHFPYCLNITTRKHFTSITQMDKQSVYAVAVALKKSLKALSCVYNNLPYNICFYGAPKGSGEHWHFHIQIVPRKHNFAGFEISTGCYINSVSPEKAARELLALDAWKCGE